MTPPVCPSDAGYCFPAAVISHTVWLYFRFPLGLRMVEGMLAARGIIVSNEGVRRRRASLAGTSPTGSGGACLRPEQVVSG